MSLKPERSDNLVAIPSTFDVRTSTTTFKPRKLYLCILIYFLALVLVVLSWIFVSDLKTKFWLSVLLVVVLPLVLRYGVLHERYLRKMTSGLKEHNYTYSSSAFWSIYDISGGSQSICRFVNGTLGMFVRLDKGVIVGKPDDGYYDHHEAVADALRVMTRRGIQCTHVDYMNSVGADSRMQTLFNNLDVCKSETLRSTVSTMYDFVLDCMSLSYATYDIYCFTYRGTEQAFRDEMKTVLATFKSANYRRAEVLGRNQVRDLMGTLLNLEDFSVTGACETTLQRNGGVSYLRTLWTEQDGVHEFVGKTSKQLVEDRRISEQERAMAKEVARHRRKGAEPPQDVNLFGEGTLNSEKSESDIEIDLFS